MWYHSPTWKPPAFFFCLISLWYIMTTSNGNVFRVTGLLCGEFTGQRWIPLLMGELWVSPMSYLEKITRDISGAHRLLDHKELGFFHILSRHSWLHLRQWAIISSWGPLRITWLGFMQLTPAISPIMIYVSQRAFPFSRNSMIIAIITVDHSERCIAFEFPSISYNMDKKILVTENKWR